MTPRRRRALLLLSVAMLAGIASAPYLYERGYVRLNYPRRASYPVRGVDVSSHQGTIDWSLLTRTTSIDFAFIKSSEGARLKDRRFSENWAASKGKVARGAYHFFTFCSPGRAQGENLMSTVTTPGELPAAVDIEFAGNCVSWTSIDAIRAELRAFLETIAPRWREPILYVTKESHERLIRGHFDEYPLWVREVVRHPSRTAYPRMVFWQYAGNGRAQGVDGLVDLNAFIGTRERYSLFLSRTST